MVFKSYADDYETESTVDETGRERRKAVYRGKYFEVNLDQAGIAAFKKASLILFASIAVFHVAGGFIANQGMYQFYIALPYVMAFFPLLYMAAGIFRLPTEKRPYRRDEVGLSFERAKNASLLALVMLAAGVVGEVFFILLTAGKSELLGEFLYLLTASLTTALVFYFVRLQGRIKINMTNEG